MYTINTDCRNLTGNWTNMKAHPLTKKRILGVVFNTDGISPFKSSRLTVWPIFISFWNLPPRVRMLKQNIVTCMFWVGNCKPNMEVFLGFFKRILEEVNLKGLKVTTSQGTLKFVLKPILGVFDMIAKAPIMNMNQFNGKNGCPSCLHPGVRIGHTQTYPPSTFYQARTVESIKKTAKQAERKGRVIKGIKGRSVITSILDLPLGAPVDYMHCVLEGVVQRFLNKWITSTN